MSQILLVVAILATAGVSHAQTRAAPRTFAGVLHDNGDFLGARIVLDSVRGTPLQTYGRLTVRRYGISQQPFIATAQASDSFTVVLGSDSDRVELRIRIRQHQLVGALLRAGRQTMLNLREIGSVAQTLLDTLAGDYRFGRQLLYVTRQGEALNYVMLPSGQRGWLYPSADDHLKFIEIAPYGVWSLADVAPLTVVFRRNPEGTITELSWEERGHSPTSAVRERFRSDTVIYRSGAITLGGTITFPHGRGPFPAILLRGGAGPLTRDAWAFVTRFFLTQGFATLISDKRGVGKSSGSFDSATYADFALDERAGLEFLRHYPNVNSSVVGMWGHSEGSWVVPMAATYAAREHEPPAFVILSAPISIPPWQQNLWQAEHLPKAEGMPDTLISNLIKLQALMYKVISSHGKYWSEYRQAVQSRPLPPWFLQYVDTTSNLAWLLRSNVDLFHDPAPWLKAVPGPLLIVLGSCDHTVPSDESSIRFEEILSTRQIDYTIETVPGAGHGLQDDCGDTDRRGLNVRGYSPGYFRLIHAWLDRHAFISRSIE